MSTMREQLTNSLGTHFREEINRSLQDIKATIDPYTRFVRAENEKNQLAYRTLQAYLAEITLIQDRINNLERDS